MRSLKALRQRLRQESLAAVPGDPEQILEISEQVMDADGVLHTKRDSREGFPSLVVDPVAGKAKLSRLSLAVKQKLDGFDLLHSPEKLQAAASRGVAARWHREVFLSHEAVAQGRADPITAHELHHAYLGRCEETGKKALFLGGALAKGGPMSSFLPDRVGYFSYLSFQEVPAFSIQLYLLATAGERVLSGKPLPDDPSLEVIASEIHDIASWGHLVGGRIADIASRGVETLDADESRAIFYKKNLETFNRPVVASNVWCKVELDSVTIDVPVQLPKAKTALKKMLAAEAGSTDDWNKQRAKLLPDVRARLEAMAAAAQDTVEPYKKILELTQVGASNEMIAEALQISRSLRHTVCSHLAAFTR